MAFVKNGFFLIIFGFVASWPVQASDLLEVYRLARGNDPQLWAQVAAVQAALEAKPQARALFFPTVDISSNFNWTTQNLTLLQQRVDPDTGFTIPGFKGSFINYGYSLNLAQPIYQRENFVLLKQADATIAQARANLVAEEQGLLVRASERYFGVLTAQTGLSFAQAEKEAIAKQLEQTKQRFEVGMNTIVDVNEAQAAYDLAVAQVIAAENALSNSYEQLREVTGQYVRDLADLKDNTPLLKPDPMNIDRWAETALQQNPQIDASAAAVDNARQEIQRQKSGHYPTLEVVGSKSTNVTGGGRFGGFQNDMDVIGLQFNLPLLQGGAVVSRTREAQHQLKQALEQLEQARRQVFRQTREAYLGVVSEASQVKALQQAIVSNQSSLEATEAGFDVGTRTTVDVLNVRRDLFRALRDHAQSRYEHLLDTLRLKQGAGIITLRDLEEINQLLQE
ncbi:Type I secretion outer membrane protein, TolC [Nitrosococcus oceani ATCC 19707]|uniref:Type I secretion outer membrane protein, TolC n=1 Tax=Nitrosococcus oceani (strain ATCC 19707 / BCRC 17464 / JCM 30415 / NCIMB 11848 / C-107) TaxID=323261 RepID=Q3J7X7_NITOC|nr:TolC family outer membrane protein [Nitrosococcus oceani]ABA59069.1 Type I secretion outer membrane protein, TolC [Nitrosococcus oceani ATCC 19707]GEM21169.1 type I secretion protein TolC [Nitrosococcus oceani]